MTYAILITICLLVLCVIFICILIRQVKIEKTTIKEQLDEIQNLKDKSVQQDYIMDKEKEKYKEKEKLDTGSIVDDFNATIDVLSKYSKGS